MLSTMDSMCKFWEKQSATLKAKRENIAPSSEYLGQFSRISREIDICMEKLRESVLIKNQMQEDQREDWPVGTDDLPWFFPSKGDESIK